MVDIILGMFALLGVALALSTVVGGILRGISSLVPESRRQAWAVYHQKWHRPHDLVQIEESISLAEYHGDEPAPFPIRGIELTKPPKYQ